MGVKQDYLMRMINDIVRGLALVLTGKKEVRYELPEEEEKDSGADAAYRELARLIDEGRINEAENRLCDYLEEHDYSREEIYDGLRELAARFGVTGLDIRM